MSKPAQRDFIFAVDLDGVVVDYYKAIRPIAAEWLNKDPSQLTEDFSYGFAEWGLPKDGELRYDYMHRWAVKQKDIFLNAPDTGRRVHPAEALLGKDPHPDRHPPPLRGGTARARGRPDRPMAREAPCAALGSLLPQEQGQHRRPPLHRRLAL